MHCAILNWRRSFAETFFASPRQPVVEKVKREGAAMGVALQVNFALWLMIVCAAMQANRLVEYLN
jgi:hypothetical protein